MKRFFLQLLGFTPQEWLSLTEARVVGTGEILWRDMERGTWWFWTAWGLW